MVFFILLLAMHTDDPLERALSRLVHDACHAKSSEESARIRTQAAEFLDTNPRYLPAFCHHYLVEFRDVSELSAALSIVSRMKSTYAATAEAAATVLHSDRVTVHYKRAACHVVARNAGTMKPPAVKALFKGLPDAAGMRLSDALLIHINRFPEENRREVFRLVGENSASRDVNVRRRILESVMACAAWSEELYLEGMHTDDQVVRGLAQLVHESYNNSVAIEESAEYAGGLQTWAAELLDANPRCVATFCNRFVVEFQDEWELNVALSVLGRMKSTHVTITEATAKVFHTDRATIHYKHAACSVVARNAGTMKPPAVQALFKGLSDELAVSLSCKLLTDINRFAAGDRLEILRIALEVSKKIPGEGTGLLGSITASVEGGTGLYDPEKYEKLYLEGLKKFTAPHHKALLIIGLLEKDPTKYKELEAQLRELAAEDKLSRWYWEKNKESNEWWEKNKELYE